MKVTQHQRCHSDSKFLLNWSNQVSMNEMKAGFISASYIWIFSLCRHIYYEMFPAGRSRQNTRSYRPLTFHYQRAALEGTYSQALN